MAIKEGEAQRESANRGGVRNACESTRPFGELSPYASLVLRFEVPNEKRMTEMRELVEGWLATHN